MATWSFDEAARSAFAGSDDGDKYIERLLSSAKDVAGSISRYMLLLIVCMASFELLNRGLVDSVSLALLKLRDVLPVTIFLPVIAAYLQYQILRQVLRWRGIERAYTATTAVVHPEISANQLDGYLVSAAPLFSIRQPDAPVFGRLGRVQQLAEGVFVIVVSILLPTFQVYAYVQLYRHSSGKQNFLLLSSLVASSTLTITYGTCLVLMICAFFRRLYHDHYLAEESIGYRLHWWLYRRFTGDR